MTGSSDPSEGVTQGPLEKAVERFLRYLTLERGRSDNTLKAYRADLSLYLSWLRGKGVDQPGAVDEALIELYSRDLSGTATTIQRRLSAVRSFHAYLAETGVSPSNPARHVHGPRAAERLPKALSVAQVTRLLESIPPDDAKGLRDRALLEVLYATGARVSEVVGLALDDVFTHERETSSLLRVIGKGNRERVVPLGSHARAALEAYVVRGRPLLAGAAKRHSAGLFLGLRGRPLSRQGVWAILRDRAAAAGISEPLSPHTLRHSCATHLIQGGADIRVVQELLGHQSVQTTQIYTKVTIDSLRDVFYTSHPRARG